MGLEKLTNGETLRISEGALFIASRMPTSCDLKRDIDDSVWVPKLLIAIPTEGKPFIVDDASIKQEGTDYYIIRDKEKGGGASVWYANEDIEKTLNLHGYVLIPGTSKSVREPIYVFDNSFIPDETDSNQGRLDVLLVPGIDHFGYSDRDRGLTAHVRIRDLPQIFCSYLLSLRNIPSFGYDCYHSGSVGLSSRKEGWFDCSLDRVRKAHKAIYEDLGNKLNNRT